MGRHQTEAAYLKSVLFWLQGHWSEPDPPRFYWLDMNDRSLVMAMTQGIGAHLTNDEKRAHLTDLKREHLIDQVCIQEILPPE
jgi:hypothetical protein